MQKIRRVIYNFFPVLVVELHYLLKIKQAIKNNKRKIFIKYENKSIKTKILYLACKKFQHNTKWGYFSGNMDFEIIETLKDNIDANNTEVIIEFWNERNDIEKIFMKYLENKNILSVVFLYDSIDPNRYDFTWIDIFKQYECQKHVVSIHLDLVHPLIQFNIATLGKLIPNLICVSIDIKPPSYLKKYTSPLGPLPLPFSKGTLDEIQRINNYPINYKGLVFHGTLYKNRIDSLKAIERSGLEIIINPHLENIDHFATYEIFFKSILQSEINLNLSLNSYENRYQLKSRVLELAMVGRPFVSDGTQLIPSYLTEGTDYIKLDPISTIMQRYAIAIQNKERSSREEDINKISFNSEIFWKKIMECMM